MAIRATLVVFGAAIGSQMDPADYGGASYGAFIIPGLIMLTLLSESTSNASFGIYMPRFTGAIYELLSAPVGATETLIGFVGAAALKSLIIAAIILATATLFVDYSIAHPVLAVGYIVLDPRPIMMSGRAAPSRARATSRTVSSDGTPDAAGRKRSRLGSGTGAARASSCSAASSTT